MKATQRYEVEVKTLLGSQDNAETFVANLKRLDPNAKQTAQSSQLNHYFDNAGDPDRLYAAVEGLLSSADQASLKQLLADYSDFSLRTRLENGTVLLVIKAARQGEDKDHALSRMEGEYQVTTDSIETLDEAILSAGFGYLSKWSRDRTEYAYKDYTVCIDKNAGYGYLAEVEQLVDDESAAQSAKSAILAELTELGFEELPQDRLGRMFAHYNEHWPEYYRTDKTFTIA